MAIVVGIINGHSLAIDTRHGNLPSKSKLLLYKALIHYKIRLK